MKLNALGSLLEAAKVTTKKSKGKKSLLLAASEEDTADNSQGSFPEQRKQGILTGEIYTRSYRKDSSLPVKLGTTELILRSCHMFKNGG